MVDEEMLAKVDEYITKCDEAYLEYEEKHDDAGGVYAHLVFEGGGSHAVEKLKEYLTEYYPDVTIGELGKLIDALDKWAIELQPGHRFTTINSEEGVMLDGWPLEEVENQYEVSVMAEALDMTEAEVCECVKALAEKNDHCIRCEHIERGAFETYQCTDACWFAVLPKSWIDDQLEEYRAEEEDEED